jgi:hypothetical protein
VVLFTARLPESQAIDTDSTGSLAEKKDLSPGERREERERKQRSSR